MIFIVALYASWCHHLESLPDVKPQLYADNLKCSAERPRALFASARFISLLSMSVLLVKMFHPVSVFFLVLPGLFVGL